MNEFLSAFKETISAQEMSLLPLRQFEGEIILVEAPADVREAVSCLKRARVLGFDTETKPSFRKGNNHKVALLQLATHDQAFLFRVAKTGIPDALRNLLSDPRIMKAGVAIHDDLKALQKIRAFKPGGFVELQEKAKKMGIRDFSLKKLCAILLGFRISKSQQLSNWEAEELTPQQMVYAATDAWASLIINDKFQQVSP
ncbi:MAG: 3'-5' exonuclease [Prolixibacteraceae bacterium]|jgi:ribonuclease D|nr:3'-5' exonuclease domain-containing protein 2 [Prolixibacteraceae bacterium]MDI9562656.1 3'-5' exonuclease [Bacteroidota bacterium]NLT00283.1 3'-5' exonuclease domain-containing protein 2 [Bacteroidales bacterium]HNU77220.1 3'-5' exonuclease [Prolixibacteraceae bacterium]HOC86929.1 3'-5' exonuclease [Prolixibacteraceae bacterium]